MNQQLPLCDLTGTNSVWGIAVRVMDTLEQCGKSADANRFFCAFMIEKDKPELADLIWRTVDLVAW